MNILISLDNRTGVQSPSKPPKQATRPSRAEAEQAVTRLIRWAGDDPDREGLIETPARVVRAYEEWFAGYGEDPDELLRRTFEEVGGYDEMVLLRDIRFVSHCGHHMAPIVGRAHIGYLPRNRVVGISKLARIVEVYARRLQITRANYGGDRQYLGSGASAARGCRGRRGGPWLHDQPRRAPVQSHDGDEPHARSLS
jgi:hypothetical protein